MALPPLKYHHVIGIMSGTSLHGLDLAYCVFKQGKSWEYEVRKAETLPYPEELRQKLAQAMTLSGYELSLLHNELGRFIGLQVKEFMAGFAEEVELIASHGHTVFHRPELGLTIQIGNGAVIAATCGKPVVCDFRTTDVALGGQGAPLVPIGDELLYGQYDICLNLGGISNLSFRQHGQRKAYDISPCNIVLNHLAQQCGKAYDVNGEIARSGHVDTALLEQFNQLDYYKSQNTKSLGREWIDSQFFPLLKQCQLSIPDQMCTVCEHIAEQIANACNATGIKNCNSNGDTSNFDKKTCNANGDKNYDIAIRERNVCNTTGGKNLLITGGGAHNRFLIGLIRQKFNGEVIIPDDRTIDFKEAIIFAFLGFLRINNLPNCLASVTGARHNSCGGAIYIASDSVPQLQKLNVSDCVPQSQEPNVSDCVPQLQKLNVSDCVPQSQNTEQDNYIYPYFDIQDVEHLHQASKLPHWHQDNKYVFITFRLFDSIPQKKLKELREEKDHWMKLHPKPWNEEERKEYIKRFASKIDKWLDNGYGNCLLKRPENRKIVEDALFYYNRTKYHLKAYVVMPNHVHILLQLFENQEMEAFVKSIKSYTAKKINQTEHRTGKVWQTESYDHLVRNEDNYKHILKYIQANDKDLAWIEDECIP